ncbi:MAG TPA: hypothetical protein VGV40_11500 [Solirubrobacteraceae bacterium]|nr:hypothetical protein [Solirubrobacteraceae bacterium]
MPSLADPSELPARLRTLPAGAALVRALGEHPHVHLVGGAVRDLLLGREPRELDVVVEGDATVLALQLDPGAVIHERFGTASTRLEGHAVDLATARRERYPEPGALPEVEPASLEEDLLRRDVAINALAVGLADGSLREVPGALGDLAAGRLRVLHDASFVDDPTRLHRVARYAARLGFALEEHTAELAAAAVRGGALATVSGPRVGAELRLAATEPEPLAALGWMERLGLVRAPASAPAAIHAARSLLGGEGREDLLVLGGWGVDGAQRGFTAGELAVLDRLVEAGEIAAAALRAERPSQVHAVLSVEPLEAVALAGALGAGEPVRLFLDELRHVRLSITGDDLLAAGIASGPDVGRRLRAALAARLDATIEAGHRPELAAALAA